MHHALHTAMQPAVIPASITKLPHLWTDERIVRHARAACLASRGNFLQGERLCPFGEQHQAQLHKWIDTYHTAQHNLAVSMRMAGRA